jgi:hypothetical protein
MVTPMPFRHAAAAAPNADNWIHAAVLVLNASYEALTEITADRAVVLLMTGAARRTARPRRPACGSVGAEGAHRYGPNPAADLEEIGSRRTLTRERRDPK